MNNKSTIMNKPEILQEYLSGLYEGYDAFQTEYKRLHRRSKMHDYETVAEYYLRWRDKMRNEISRIEMVLLKNLPKQKPDGENGELCESISLETVEIFQLQNVGIY